MAIFLHLSTLAVRPLIGGACEALGLGVAQSAGDAVVGFLTRRFTDHSQRLTLALREANERSWRTLEVSLAGDSLWERCKGLLAPSDEKAFRQQVQAFLDATPLGGLASHGPEFRQQCLRELRAARKAGAFAGSLDPQLLAEHAGTFARFGDAQAVVAAEWQMIDQMAGALREFGFPAAAQLVALRPEKGPALLPAAAQYFFRRQVEEDRELFQGLAFAQLEKLQQGQEAGFAALADVMGRHADVLDPLLTTVSEIDRKLDDLQTAVQELLTRHRLSASVAPQTIASIGNEGEQKAVRALVERFRAVPAEDRRRAPESLNSLGTLLMAVGWVDLARELFAEAATLVNEDGARAIVHHNSYLAALEARDWPAALAALHEAARIDAERWAPFPWTKYEAQGILGAGGFGVAFLCRHRKSEARVVVKSIRSEGLDRSLSDVFREARVLEDLDHPAIIRLKDCDFADKAETRPFLVMEYFDGLPLDEHVKQHGPLSADDTLAVMRPVAAALHAAHQRGILHRDVKPGNLLLRKDGNGWRVKLIDFGLALKQDVMHTAGPAKTTQTIAGRSIAGTLDYAAPEQMGRLPGVKVGPQSDVYGFGKTCCYALFKTPQPLRKHWREVPESLADLLEQCLGETPDDRPADFSVVLQRLEPASPPKPAPPPPPASPSRERFWAPPAAPEPKLAPSLGKDMVLTGHTGPVTTVAFSPDGRFVVSGSDDMTVRVWDVAKGKEHRCFTGHTREIGNATFFPDSGRVLSSSEDNSVRIWNVATGAEARCFERRTNRPVALAPDGRLALTGSLYDGMLRLWDLATGEELRRLQGHTDFVLRILFSLDGKHALSLSRDNSVRYWQLATGRMLRQFSAARLNLERPDLMMQPTGYSAGQTLSTVLAISGEHALFGSPDASGWFGMWNLRTGRQLFPYGRDMARVLSAQFTPDASHMLLGCADGVVRLDSVTEKRESARFHGHEGPVLSVASAPDARRAVSGGADGTVRLWELPEVNDPS